MSVKWHDVSVRLHPKVTVWPGDPPFEFSPKSRIENGDSSNTSIICMSTHAGTHIDAPWHYDQNGPRLDEVDSSIFFGEALVIELPDVDVITAAGLGSGPLPSRVLFKTRNSEISLDEPFRSDYVGVSGDAARRLVEEKVRLVGIDYLSIAPYKQEGQDTHHTLLGQAIVAIEGLRLDGIPPGPCQFVVLPLPVADADGAPCRAFVGLEESA